MDSVFAFGVAVVVVVVVAFEMIVVVTVVAVAAIVVVTAHRILKEGENKWNGIFGKAYAHRFPFGVMAYIFRDNGLLYAATTTTSS